MQHQTYFWPSILISLAIVITVLVYKSASDRPNQTLIAQWTFVSALNIARRAHCSVTANGFVYVIGGVDRHNNYVGSAEYAKVKADGTLLTWQSTTSLQQPRFYLDCVAANGFVYAIGGGSGQLGDANQPIASVERARILQDGSLSDWQYDSDMTSPRRGLKTRIIGQYVFALGGYYGQFLKTVEFTKISIDGSLSDWQLVPQSFQVDRYIHAAASHKNHLYLLGGHVNQSNRMSYSDVESAQVMQSGTLSAWNIESSRINIPRFIASAFALNRKLYILGGHSGGIRINRVEVAPIYRDGHIGQFEFSIPLNSARSAAAITTYKNHVYVTGGMGNEGILNTVEMATQTQNGKLGTLIMAPEKSVNN